MDGAVFALILNACVALLFALAFGIIRLSYPGQREVTWFCAIYLLGSLTPISELGVHFTELTLFFSAASYMSLLLAVVAMPLALAANAGLPMPWRTAGAVYVAGIVTRVAIWGGPRDHFGYELLYQAPMAAASGLAAWMAGQVYRRQGGRLWLALAVMFGFITLYFLTKPLFAGALGSGATSQAYAASRYALFSQATSGMLMVGVGLVLLLIAVNAAIGQTILESESDVLTGIANRRGFERRAARMIAVARQTGSPLAVVVFDLDDFKAVNDSYGHSTGDAVIRAFAALLRTTTFPTAAIARLGGEEFVMMLDRTPLLGAWHAAQTVRRTQAALGSDLPPVTVSGGVAELEPDDTLESLLNRADQWAYAAKTGGRNRICPTPVLISTERRVPSLG